MTKRIFISADHGVAIIYIFRHGIWLSGNQFDAFSSAKKSRFAFCGERRR